MVFLETFRAMVACKNRRIFCLLLYATKKYNFIHINLYIFFSGTKQQYRRKIRLFSQASTTENISTLWNWTKLWKLESPISDMYPCVTSTSVCISLKAQQKGARVTHINFWHPKNYNYKVHTLLAEPPSLSPETRESGERRWEWRWLCKQGTRFGERSGISPS